MFTLQRSPARLSCAKRRYAHNFLREVRIFNFASVSQKTHSSESGTAIRRRFPHPGAEAEILLRIIRAVKTLHYVGNVVRNFYRNVDSTIFLVWLIRWGRGGWVGVRWGR